MWAHKETDKKNIIFVSPLTVGRDTDNHTVTMSPVGNNALAVHKLVSTECHEEPETKPNHRQKSKKRNGESARVSSSLSFTLRTKKIHIWA